MIRIIRNSWDRFSIYLPMLLMGILALGTYWLIRSTPNFEFAPGEIQLQHDPDYRMRKFSLRTFEANGRLKNELTGEEARHYPDTDTLEIEQIKIVSLSSSGRISTATANRALVNGDATEVQLLGNAEVVRESAREESGKISPRISIQSEFLHAFLETEVVKSHKPVELLRGNSKFTASTMDFDNLEQVLNLRGRVRGTLLQQNDK